LEKRAEKILGDLEENLNFMSQLGIKYFLEPIQSDQHEPVGSETLESSLPYEKIRGAWRRKSEC
jgi:hypothetical protein